MGAGLSGARRPAHPQPRRLRYRKAAGIGGIGFEMEPVRSSSVPQDVKGLMGPEQVTTAQNSEREEGKGKFSVLCSFLFKILSMSFSQHSAMQSTLSSGQSPDIPALSSQQLFCDMVLPRRQFRLHVGEVLVGLCKCLRIHLVQRRGRQLLN